MTRYVKRMVGRRVFSCGLSCAEDYQANPHDRWAKVSEDRVIESRMQFYQGKLVDAMLKILYLERFSAE